MPRRSWVPVTGTARRSRPLSVRHGDKAVVNLAAKLLELGYDLDATHGTAVTLGGRHQPRAW